MCERHGFETKIEKILCNNKSRILKAKNSNSLSKIKLLKRIIQIIRIRLIRKYKFVKERQFCQLNWFGNLHMAPQDSTYSPGVCIPSFAREASYTWSFDAQGIKCNTQCEVCQQCTFETTKHLFFQCNHARRIWARVNTLLGFNILANGDIVQGVAYNSSRLCQRIISRMQWGSVFYAVCWFIWRGRNKKIFDGIETSPH